MFCVRMDEEDECINFTPSVIILPKSEFSVFVGF